MRRYTGHGHAWKSLWIACFLFSPLLLLSQEPAYHPWPWEVGIRTTNLGHYYQSAGPFANQPLRPVLGYELYILQCRANHVFTRIGIGYNSRRREEFPYRNIVANPSSEERSFYQSAFTAEAAIGWELPKIQRKWADRLRFRTGLSLAIQFQQSQVVRVYQENATDVYGYYHDTYWGGSLWMPSAFLNTQFRLFKGAFAGLEWRYGPRFRGGRIHHMNDELVAGLNGYQFERQTSTTRILGLNFPVPSSLPSFSLSYSF